jgi:tRNA threonylcarbamoyladenosine biosynthesis protein TsaB
MISPLVRCLAFDTSTERMSVALMDGDRVWSHDAPGGAMASTTLIPSIMAMLGEAGLRLGDLGAIAFGRGPGAFTGLRTACAVAQGLAFGAGRPVLPIDTLLAVAEDARHTPFGGQPLDDVWVTLDARMDEIYAVHAVFEGGFWKQAQPPLLCTPEALSGLWRVEPPVAVAGSALAAFGARLETGTARLWPEAAPRARAMLPLAAALWAAGGAVTAADARPLYLRDKVAQTTAERAVIKARAAEAAVAALPPASTTAHRP